MTNPIPIRPAGPRVQPHDLAAEAALLGACLLKPEAIDAAGELKLTAGDFYNPRHGVIFAAIESLHRRGEPADPVTVADELHRDGTLEQVGGGSALVALQTGTPAISSAPRYARIIADHAVLRRLIGVAAEIADLSYGLPDNVAEAAASAANKLTAVTDNIVIGAAQTMWADMPNVADTVPAPTLCPRADDACCFLYAGRLHNLSGESEAGKSWLSLHWCAQLVNEGEHVVYLDYEDSAEGHKARLLAMGVHPDNITDFFHYAQRDTAWTEATRAELSRSLDTWKPALVVVDAMTPALATEGIDDWRATDVAKFYTDVVRLCRNAGAAVLVLDHTNKNKPDDQTGSFYKKGGIDGVSYVLLKATPMGRGLHGKSTLIVRKDRHGYLRGLTVESGVIGSLSVDSTGDATVLEVVAPVGAIGSAAADGSKRYPAKMQAVSELLETAGERGLARTTIYEAIKGNRNAAIKVVKDLLSEGFITNRGAGTLLWSVHPFRVDAEVDS